MIFIVLPSLETVHDTVQYWYSIFSLLYHLFSIRPKSQNALYHTYEKQRESTL